MIFFGILFYAVIGFLCSLLVIDIYVLIKNERTYKMHIIVTNAICSYQLDCIEKGIRFEVNYDDEEQYDKTLHRWWDWGYKRILPKEKFELIKKYIKD